MTPETRTGAGGVRPGWRGQILLNTYYGPTLRGRGRRLGAQGAHEQLALLEHVLVCATRFVVQILPTHPASVNDARPIRTSRAGIGPAAPQRTANMRSNSSNCCLALSSSPFVYSVMA